MNQPPPLSVRLPKPVEAQLRAYTKRTGAKMNPFVAEAVREKLDREEMAAKGEPVFITSQRAVVISLTMAMELRPITLSTPLGMRWARTLRELREAANGSGPDE